MRIEAASYRGKPVYFELIGPWTRPERMRPYEPTVGEKAGLVFFIVLSLCWSVAPCSPDGTCALAGATAVGPSVWQRLFLWLGRLRGSLAHITSRTSPKSRSSSSSWSGGAVFSASRGFSTSLWNPMCVGAGPPHWSPGVACWREAFGIHWWDATCLPVAFFGRFDRSRKTGMVRSPWFGYPPPQPYSASAVAVSGRAHHHCEYVEQGDLRANFSRLRFCLSWSFCGPCCATSGRLRLHVYFCSRSSAQRSPSLVPLTWRTLITTALTVFL